VVDENYFLIIACKSFSFSRCRSRSIQLHIARSIEMKKFLFAPRIVCAALGELTSMQMMYDYYGIEVPVLAEIAFLRHTYAMNESDVHGCKRIVSKMDE
jgi:hypothetical protein